MGDNASSYRCSICALNFPPDREWYTCANCGGDTADMQHAQPNITTEEAESMRNHRLFEEYLEERDGVKQEEESA